MLLLYALARLLLRATQPMLCYPLLREKERRYVKKPVMSNPANCYVDRLRGAIGSGLNRRDGTRALFAKDGGASQWRALLQTHAFKMMTLNGRSR